MAEMSAFVGTLPYASELFGVYQPLLGWKSAITAGRIDAAAMRSTRSASRALLEKARTELRIRIEGDAAPHLDRAYVPRFEISNLRPLTMTGGPEKRISPSIDCATSRLLSERLGSTPPESWSDVVNITAMSKLLDELHELVQRPDVLSRHPAVGAYIAEFVGTVGVKQPEVYLRALFEKEARIAGYLVHLSQYTPSQLTQAFFTSKPSLQSALMQLADPLAYFSESAGRHFLSPVGVIHLYREYFFEFDSFLGPPVGHIWLSPGGTTELVEINTRKVATERIFEESLELQHRSEAESTQQDDIADAVKEENRNNIKFGFTNTANYTTPVFQDTAVASFSIDNAKMSARESTHKQMRQQSEKLSSEIKRNYKTTFRTSTEVTDTTSKRYVIQNTSKRLVNYELRRKMRKVGVQVQDIGIQMCWHTFVDDPGRELGVARFVHLGEPPDLAGLVPPEAPGNPGIELEEVSFSVPFQGIDTSDNDQAYTHGSETEVGDIDETEHIRADFPQGVTFAKPGYTLTHVVVEAVAMDAVVSVRNVVSEPDSSRGSFDIHLDYVNWQERDQFTVKAKLTWAPSEASAAAARTAYNAAVSKFNAESARRYKDAFIKASRERIKLASQVRARPAEHLREEERTVVYRRLISQLMGVSSTESKHVLSELVRSIFDVDKMLYFVAPEWWVPRLHRSTQQLGDEIRSPEGPGAPAPSADAPAGMISADKFNLAAVRVESVLPIADIAAKLGKAGDARPKQAPIPGSSLVDWGGAKEQFRDNYYITEESNPAKLGSSLGWLLQLDGDNLRNAILNAPWVKAVIPIRIGKEKEAIEWLQQAHVEGNDGLNAQYVSADDDPEELVSTDEHSVSVLEALHVLAKRISEFDQRVRNPVAPNPADPEDPSNHFAGSLPTEAVFESGFYPLKGGVRFGQDGVSPVIFSQWVEVLPTDQIAAVEVEYDPKTLQVRNLEQPPRDGGSEPPP